MNKSLTPLRWFQFRLLSLLAFITLSAVALAWATRPWRTLQMMQGEWRIVLSARPSANAGIFRHHINAVVSVSGDQFSGVALDHPSYSTPKRIILPMNVFSQTIHLQETHEPHFRNYSGKVRIRNDILELWIEQPDLLNDHKELEHVILRRVENKNLKES